MRICRLMSVLCAAAFLLAGCCRKPAPPPLSPVAVTGRWWQAIVSGDDRGVVSHFSDDSVWNRSARVLAEYVRVETAAGEGDRLAVEMLARLKGVGIGEVRSGSELAIVPLVFEDGTAFLDVRLELRDGRWMIVDIRSDQ